MECRGNELPGGQTTGESCVDKYILSETFNCKEKLPKNVVNNMFMADFQNVLEMHLYDRDKAKCDDLISVVLFDISQLKLGQKDTKTFITHPEVNIPSQC